MSRRPEPARPHDASRRATQERDRCGSSWTKPRARALVGDFIRDALRSARAELAVVETDEARTADLVKKSYASQAQLDVLKARLDEARVRVKQLEAILATAGAAPTGAAPKSDRDALTPDQIKLAAGFAKSDKPDAEVIEAVYQAVVGRKPTTAERDFAVGYLASMPKDRETALTNIIFSMVHSKEYRRSGNRQ